MKKSKSKLYKGAFWRKDLRPAEITVAKLVIRRNRPCTIEIPPANPSDIEKRELKKGGTAGRLAVMNYGYIFGWYVIYIFDKEANQWYFVDNKPDRESWQSMHKPTFIEADKVELSDRYFYDGTIQELIKEIKKAGIKVKKYKVAEI